MHLLKGCVFMAKPCTDVYEEPIIFNFPGAIVKVFRPILTEEERARRMKILHDAAADLLKYSKK